MSRVTGPALCGRSKPHGQVPLKDRPRGRVCRHPLESVFVDPLPLPACPPENTPLDELLRPPDAQALRDDLAREVGGRNRKLRAHVHGLPSAAPSFRWSRTSSGRLRSRMRLAMWLRLLPRGLGHLLLGYGRNFFRLSCRYSLRFFHRVQIGPPGCSLMIATSRTSMSLNSTHDHRNVVELRLLCRPPAPFPATISK